MSVSGFAIYEKFFLGFLILAASAMIYLVSREDLLQSFISDSKPQGAVIGKVSAVSDEARRRQVGSLRMVSLRSDQKLYQDDTIYNGPASGTEIKLNNMNLRLGENTLIRLLKDEKGLVVDFQGGNVEAGAGSRTNHLRIRSKGRVTEVTAVGAKTIRWASNASGDLAFSVPSGTAELTVNAQTITVSADEAVRIKKDTSAEVVDIKEAIKEFSGLKIQLWKRRPNSEF